MKKIFFSITIIMMLLLTSIVLADMGAPEINPYKATPKSTEGAPYYCYTYDPDVGTASLVEVGTIPYGTVIKMDFESTENGIKYGHFSYGEGDNYGNFEIKLDDLTVANADEYTYKPFTTYRNMKILANDVPIHSGPAYIYDTIGMIPKGTQIFARRLSRYSEYDGREYEDEMNPWLFVEYNGISGWVCELNSAIGEYRDAELVMLVDLSISGDTVAIPANTKIKGYYQTDLWSNNALVTYHGEDYMISLYDCAVDAGEWNKEGIIIHYDNAKLFKTPSKDGEVLAEIPNGSVIPVKYAQFDLRWIGWILTEYDGVEGWALYFETDEAIADYESGNYPMNETGKGEAALVEKPTEVVKEPVSVPESTTATPTSPVMNSAPQPLVSNTIIYVGIAVIVALTATVIILLVNKKK